MHNNRDGTNTYLINILTGKIFIWISTDIYFQVFSREENIQISSIHTNIFFMIINNCTRRLKVPTIKTSNIHFQKYEIARFCILVTFLMSFNLL